VNIQKNDRLFSIVIPTYKRREALSIALRSLACQTVNSRCFEVIVVNNFPAIAVDDVVKEYSSVIDVISLVEPKCGAHSARNLGSRAARGRYLVFMDDDCEAHPSFLEKYHSAIRLHKPALAGGSIEIKWDHDPPSWVRPFEHLMGKTDRGGGCFWLEEDQMVYGGNLLVLRDFFLSVGGMDPDQFGKIILGSGDVGLNLSAIRQGHKLLWVGDAKVWHHQKRKVNAKIFDLMRREFNDGIMAAFELREKNNRLCTLERGPLSARLFHAAVHQFLSGAPDLNKHALANACLSMSKLIGLNWFYLYKSRMCT